jgi:hypothetical protein
MRRRDFIAGLGGTVPRVRQRVRRRCNRINISCDVSYGSCVTSIAGPNGMRNCTGDEGRPFEVGDQVLASSHRKLLSSKAMVVSVAEKPGQDSGRQG